MTDIAQRITDYRVATGTGKTSVGKLPTKWTNDQLRFAGIRWMQTAEDRSLWRGLKKAYVDITGGAVNLCLLKDRR